MTMEPTALKTTPPANLDRLLSAVRVQWILRDVAFLAAWLLIAILVPAMALSGLDNRLHFGPILRVLELIGLVIWLTWLIRRLVIPTARCRRDTKAAALRIEMARASLAGRLITAVELQPAPTRGSGDFSPGLLQALRTRLERDLAQLTAREVVGTRDLREPVALAIGVALAAAVLLARDPAVARVWLVRTLQPWKNVAWPPRTHLAELPLHLQILEGEAATITGNVSGAIPTAGVMSWSVAGHPDIVRADFPIRPDGSFAATTAPLNASATMHLQAGDAVSAMIRVEVIRPPMLAGIEALLTYPVYSGRTAERLPGGDIRALVGTHVKLGIVADRSLARIELRRSGQLDRRQLAPVTLASPTTGHADFVVRESLRYQVLLYDASGRLDNSPPEFLIEPIEDALPQITVLAPPAHRAVAPGTQLSIRYRAEDDFAITGLQLAWSLRPGATISTRPDITEFPEHHLPIPLEAPSRQVSSTFSWDLSSINAAPGDELVYWLEATDQGEHVGEPLARSPKQAISIVEPDTLDTILRRRESQTLGQARRLQAQLSSQPAGSPRRKSDAIAEPQAETTRLLRLVEQVAGELAGLQEELQGLPQAAGDRLAALQDAGEDLAQAAQELRPAATAGPPGPALPNGAAPSGRVGLPQKSDQVAVTPETRPAGEEPWYTDLPPKQQQAVRQSLEEPFPPDYEAAIKRYYERLSRPRPKH